MVIYLVKADRSTLFIKHCLTPKRVLKYLCEEML